MTTCSVGGGLLEGRISLPGVSMVRDLRHLHLTSYLVKKHMSSGMVVWTETTTWHVELSFTVWTKMDDVEGRVEGRYRLGLVRAISWSRSSRIEYISSISKWNRVRDKECLIPALHPFWSYGTRVLGCGHMPSIPLLQAWSYWGMVGYWIRSCQSPLIVGSLEKVLWCKVF